jgi:hypothetical protein
MKLTVVKEMPKFTMPGGKIYVAPSLGDSSRELAESQNIFARLYSLKYKRVQKDGLQAD